MCYNPIYFALVLHKCRVLFACKIFITNKNVLLIPFCHKSCVKMGSHFHFVRVQ